MLMSIVLLAVVGGALAFKASTKFGVNFCTTAPRTVLGVEVCTDAFGAALSCPTTTFDATTTTATGTKKCYTTTTSTTCGGSCPNLAVTQAE